MMNLEKLYGTLRSVSGFALVLVFLMLGSCPAKKAIRSFVNDATEQARSSSSKGNSVEVICSGIGANLFAKTVIPEQASSVIPPLAALFPSVRFGDAFIGFSENASFRVTLHSVIYRDSVPTYLKNRILLI